MELPHNSDAEKAVLCSILVDKDLAFLAFSKLRAEYFFDDLNRRVYEAMELLYSSGQPVDVISVGAKSGLGDYVKSLAGLGYSSLYVEYYTDLVLGYHKLRQLAITSSKFLAEVPKTSPTDVNNLIDKLTHEVFTSLAVGQDEGILDSKTLMRSFWEDFAAKYESGVHLDIPTGFRGLDNILAGYRKGSLVVVAARPSQGKTAFVLSSLFSVAKSSIPVLLFSYEMSREEISQRLVSVASDVPLANIRTVSGFNEEYMRRMTKAVEELSNMPIFIDDHCGDLFYLTASIRRAVIQHKIKIAAVDYLQILPMKGEDLVNEIGRITRTLKVLAGSLGITIILVSQLNRSLENRADRKPRLADLRQSGRIEEDADVVLLLHRDVDLTPEEVELYVAKHRNGPIGSVSLFFDTKTTRFC